MAIRNITLGAARKLVEAKKLDPLQIANMDAWPDDVNLAITVSSELAAELPDDPPAAAAGKQPRRGRKPQAEQSA